jgi:hypothetical protein
VDKIQTTDTENYVVARKTKHWAPKVVTKKQYLPLMHKKFDAGLGFGSHWPMGRKRLVWSFRYADLGGQLPYLGDRLADVQIRIAARCFKYWYGQDLPNKAMVFMLVEPLDRRHIADHISPIEIQFEGNIQLLYK